MSSEVKALGGVELTLIATKLELLTEPPIKGANLNHWGNRQHAVEAGAWPKDVDSRAWRGICKGSDMHEGGVW